MFYLLKLSHKIGESGNYGRAKEIEDDFTKKVNQMGYCS